MNEKKHNINREDKTGAVKPGAAKPKRRGRKSQVALAITVLVVMGFGAVYRGYIAVPPSVATQDPVITQPTDEPTTSPDGMNPMGPTPSPITETPTPDGRKPECYTFLLVGMDYAGANTDTIMVGMLDARNHKMNIISIPRDTLADVPWATKRINSVYASSSVYANGITNKAGETLTGIDALKEAVSMLVGFPIDQYVAVDIKAFQALVDSVDGVYFDVPVNMYHVDEDPSLGINLQKGYQLLNGHDALGVVRFRGYPMADIQRIQVQQAFLKAAASQMLKIGNVTKVKEWAGIFEKYVDTKMNTGNLLWYGEQFLKLKDEDIVFNSMPVILLDLIRDVSYVEVDVEAWLEMLNSTINPYIEDRTKDDLRIMLWSWSLRAGVDLNGNVLYYENQFAKGTGTPSAATDAEE